MIEQIEIKISKVKIGLMTLGSAIFVGLGIWFVLNPTQFESRNKFWIMIVGIASIIFFGACLLFMFRKLFDNSIGLIINENGITDNSSGTSVGLIEWNDITDIKTAEVASTKFILIETINPEKYIKKAKNSISKRAMKANHKMYGTPLSISSNTLQVKFDELLNTILNAFKNKQNLK
jgi:hypothetical protein